MTLMSWSRVPGVYVDGIGALQSGGGRGNVLGVGRGARNMPRKAHRMKCSASSVTPAAPRDTELMGRIMSIVSPRHLWSFLG